jgi:hypothetical protein
VLQELQDSQVSGQVYVFGTNNRLCMGGGYNRSDSNLGGNVMAKELTDAQIVSKHKPKPLYYTGTEKKKMARPCIVCGEVIQGTLATLENHVSMVHPRSVWWVESGYDYTNQAWIMGGVYVRCGCPTPGTIVDPSQPGGPGGPRYVATECQCYGRLHEGEAPMVGVSIH